MALSKAIVSSIPIVVFSKTYCGHCIRVKQLLSQLGATFKVVELDKRRNEVQAALKEWEWAGLRTHCSSLWWRNSVTMMLRLSITKLKLLKPFPIIMCNSNSSSREDAAQTRQRRTRQ